MKNEKHYVTLWMQTLETGVHKEIGSRGGHGMVLRTLFQ